MFDYFFNAILSKQKANPLTWLAKALSNFSTSSLVHLLTWHSLFFVAIFTFVHKHLKRTNISELKVKRSFCVWDKTIFTLPRTFTRDKNCKICLYFVCWAFFTDFRLSNFFLIFDQFGIFCQYKIRFFIRSLNLCILLSYWTNVF